ncbi:hypothetical protein FOB64_006061 [Candida albicans]|uniref:Uncharacterized protein n=1 Tax=Candida albicans TaxID=5476 RepID=A0A8H6BRI5_CANAX|nr:hypothetical protein FOB64_006061 [Candida albicans]
MSSALCSSMYDLNRTAIAKSAMQSTLRTKSADSSGWVKGSHNEAIVLNISCVRLLSPGGNWSSPAIKSCRSVKLRVGAFAGTVKSTSKLSISSSESLSSISYHFLC